MKKLFSILGLSALLACLPVMSFGQYLRNSYFMEGSSARMQLNPALVPSRGYLNLPVVGSLGVEINSSTLGAEDAMDIIKEGGTFYANDKFMQKLEDENTLGVKLNTDIFSRGRHTENAFISYGVGAKMDVDAKIPRAMFQYLYDVENRLFTGLREYDIENERVTINSYAEVWFGYARKIGERITIGGRVKGLLGYANMDLDVRNLDVETYIPDNLQYPMDPYSRIDADVEMHLSGKGIEVRNDSDGCVDDILMGKFGIGGYGAAVDFGVSLNLTERLSLHASVIDLGFIQWSGSSSKRYVSQTQVMRYELTEADVFNFQTFALKESESESRSVSLCPTVTLGGEYALFNNKLGAGVLYTSRYGVTETCTELSAIATFRPSPGFNATVSYSLLEGNDTFGVAVKLGPLMVGTDYMFLSDNTKHTNAYVGLSIAW